MTLDASAPEVMSWYHPQGAHGPSWRVRMVGAADEHGWIDLAGDFRGRSRPGRERCQMGYCVWKPPHAGFVAEPGWVILEGDTEPCPWDCGNPDCREWVNPRMLDGGSAFHLCECELFGDGETAADRLGRALEPA